MSINKIIACELQLEEALLFLVAHLDAKTRQGKKPVVVHSLRVASILISSGYPGSVVTAGVLHDLLEKSRLPLGRVSRKFGHDVALLVRAVTNNPRIKNSIARYRDSVDRCGAVGHHALAVRAADLIDNCDRVVLLGTHERLQRLEEKLVILIEKCRSLSLTDEIFGELNLRLRRIQRLNRLSGTSAPIKVAKKKRNLSDKKQNYSDKLAWPFRRSS